MENIFAVQRMAEEANYNMIDGLMNNTPKEKG